MSIFRHYGHTFPMVRGNRPLICRSCDPYGARRVFNTVHGGCLIRCTGCVQYGAQGVFNSKRAGCLPRVKLHPNGRPTGVQRTWHLP